MSGGQSRPAGRALHLTGLPEASEAPFAGGHAFVAYCLGAEARVKHRRNVIKRAQAAYRQAVTRGESEYATALIYAQRLGVALEDLGRLAIALEAIGQSNAFDALRGARPRELDDVFVRLRDEPALRRAFKLPTAEDVAELDEELKEPVLAASAAQAKGWHEQWVLCSRGWPLLRLLAKGMRHGSPLVPRETVLTPPGAGALGHGSEDRFERWVLVIDTDEDSSAKRISTEWTVADLSDATLVRAHAAVLDGLALARKLAGAHVARVERGYKWVLSQGVIKGLTAEHQKILERHLDD